MKLRTALFFLFLCAARNVQAGSRTSASYAVAADTADAAGRRTTSASYTQDASAGAVAGLATGTAPAAVAHSGYAAQLTEAGSLTLTAAPAEVGEGATTQLAMWQNLDDATLLAIPAASVAWSIGGGPLTGVSTGGVVTAGTVWQDTAATVRGVCLGQTLTLGLVVKNVSLDNFGTYAADGMDDAWQMQYFGANNPAAAPQADVSGTGQTNLFKYLAGLNPLDPNSRFTLSIRSVPGQPAQKQLIFAPRLTDRTYTVTSRPALSTGGYAPLANPSAPSDSGPQRTITDLGAGGAATFYRVEITKP